MAAVREFREVMPPVVGTAHVPSPRRKVVAPAVPPVVPIFGIVTIPFARSAVTSVLNDGIPPPPVGAAKNVLVA